ncbi:MAG: DNA-directed RNA polymerase subunit A' [Euryarchaeota archaeon]|nr:DNA-directed RNA polymerase subunit A' [Euryarchaeota archaeon]
MTSPKRISSIRFGLLSPKEVRKMSVTRIITADTYDEDGFPIEMGLMDQRLGVVDPGLRCKTCGGRPGECPGHFGHVDLVAPVIHVGYARMVARVLQSTCRKCSRLMLDPEERAKFKEVVKANSTTQALTIDEILRDVAKDAMKKKQCPSCGEEQGEVRFEKPTAYFEDHVEYRKEGEKVGEHKLTPMDIRDRLERVPDEDLEVFGLNPRTARPEWAVLKVLPVPPVTTRPSITLESGQRSEDDLTHKLVDIIRINQRFQENKEAGAPQLIIEDLWELLQYHVTTFMDNEVSGIPPARHRSGRPLKTLSQRLKGKEGRFRGSLSGKRVNFSARTVISPDPGLSISEVGVPEEIARELTIPVNVTPRNLEEVRATVRRATKSEGANYVKRLDSRRVKITEKNAEELATQLEVGWKVDRQLRDGDTVLFNRQPSLHRMSIMSHTVRIIPGHHKTFRFNPAVCPPYNADFDGDEMNLHVPQTEEARAEAKILMSVQENILSPRFGGPIIGGIHDHISGLFLLTHGDRRLTSEGAVDILRKTNVPHLPPPEGKDEDGQPYWTGKQLFSLILPPTLSIRFKPEIAGYDETAQEVIVRNGVLEQGTIDEAAVGAFKGKILDKIVKEFGREEARRFLDNATQMSIRPIMRMGFSFGISDEDIPRDARAQIDEVIALAKSKVEKLIAASDAGELEPMPGRTLEETLEMKIMQELGRARDRAGNIAEKNLHPTNPGVIMAVSGARGSMLNLTQMAACVGQQSVRGERISRGYYKRTLPHFKQGDKGAESRGFIRASYKSGLNATEYFFHAIGGREGLVDTAVRTSQSGYLQRRLINALQDLEAKYDGTVRETRGIVVQFHYGEDGVDPAKSDYGKSVNVPRLLQNYVDILLEE